MAADDKGDGSRFEKGDVSLFGTDHEDRRGHSRDGGLRHRGSGFPSGDHGARDSRPLSQVFEGALDQRSGVDCSDARPDDGQEIPAQICV
jgi:hypothetical protein